MRLVIATICAEIVTFLIIDLSSSACGLWFLFFHANKGQHAQEDRIFFPVMMEKGSSDMDGEGDDEDVAKKTVDGVKQIDQVFVGWDQIGQGD